MKKAVALGAVVLAVVVGAVVYLRRDTGPTYEFAVAERGALIQDVSVTGKVKAALRVELAFEASGRVARAPAAVGDKVMRGAVLLELKNDDLVAERAEAAASLTAERATLAEVERGSRPEEIVVAEVKVKNAETALQEAESQLRDEITEAYTTADNALRREIDQLFTSPETNPQLIFTIPANAQLEIDIENERRDLESVLDNWNTLLSTLAMGNLMSLASTADAYLAQIQSFLDDVGFAINTLNPTSGLSSATIDGYRTDVSTARSSINTAVSDLSTAQEKTKTKSSDLALAQSELDLTQAGSTPEEIATQTALVAQAQSALAAIDARIEKTILRAPFAGTVVRQDAKVGEIIAANEALVSLSSDGIFEIEAFIPEVDIADVETSDPASITLDAYGSDVPFTATVVSIDPAETIIDGVSTYKTLLRFDEEDPRIKSGMTANIDIHIAQRDNVIAVLQRAVTRSDGGATVQVLRPDGTVHTVAVTTGLRGSDGRVEITSGLTEGDRVITFMEEK